MKNFKILPLMIFVAMLAFSIRLVDVISGVSSLSGAAYAKDNKDSHEDDSDQHDQDNDNKLVFSEEENGHDSKHNDSSGIEWRDANDEDISYENIRMDLFKDLSARRAQVEQGEKELITRKALLRAAEKEIERKYQELSQLRQEIEKLLEKQSDEEQARIKSLVKIYEGMKAKDAARIFDTLDLDILLSVVSRMSERKLSSILAAMNPERARTITIMLAEQKQLPSALGRN